MEQQLESEIRKNKNLLQSNISLMQQNQLCTNALAKLKKFFFQSLDSRQQDQQYSVLPDEAESLVETIIQKITSEKQIKNHSLTLKTEQKNYNRNKKQCQCQKWKDLYIKESQQSFRLSKKVAQIQQAFIKLQSKYDLQCKQMDNILKQYLILFQRVNSTEFIQSQNEIRNKKTKDKQGIKQKKNENNKILKQKQSQKRSSSKSKTHTKSSSKKSNKIGQIQTDKINSAQSLPTNIVQEINQISNQTFQSSILTYLQNMRHQSNRLLLQNIKLKEEFTDYQSLIRIYRQKQRQKILYDKFLA